MFPRLESSKEERAAMVQILLDHLNDKSNIVKTFSVQALADFAEKDASLCPQVIELLEKFAKTGSPAMKSRARKLLKRLNP